MVRGSSEFGGFIQEPIPAPWLLACIAPYLYSYSEAEALPSVVFTNEGLAHDRTFSL
jgi:hypothetical protein